MTPTKPYPGKTPFTWTAPIITGHQPTPQAHDTRTVALLYREFGRVLVPLEDVRLAYFRNRNPETFRRALREGDIPLPVVTLDDSAKSPRFVCIYQLAVLIEQRAKAAARGLPVTSDDVRPHPLQLIDAVPTTDATAGHAR